MNWNCITACSLGPHHTAPGNGNREKGDRIKSLKSPCKHFHVIDLEVRRLRTADYRKVQVQICQRTANLFTYTNIFSDSSGMLLINVLFYMAESSDGN